MVRSTAFAVVMLAFIALPVMGGGASAQEPLPEEDPEVKACAFPTAMGNSLFGSSCWTGVHSYSGFLRHGVEGSFYVEGQGIAQVTSTLQVPDEDNPGQWVTAHRIKCRPQAVVGVLSDLDCKETGEIPEPGTTVRHDCGANRGVVGLVVCSIAYTT